MAVDVAIGWRSQDLDYIVVWGWLLMPQTLAITMPEQHDHTARNGAHGDTGSVRALNEGSSHIQIEQSLPSTDPLPDQMPPDSLSKLVTNQVSFHLQHLPGASRSKGGHTLIKKDSKWNGDATCLWMKTTNTKGWFWNSGRVLQM